MLCRRDTGLPVHSAMLWSLTELRATSLASATITQALRSVMVFHIVLDQLGVSLLERMEQGQLLTLAEVESLAAKCQRSLEDLCDETPRKVVALRKYAAQDGVDPLTAGIRLRYIRAYLDWLVKDRLLRMGPSHRFFAGLQVIATAVLEAIDARTPEASRRNTLGDREGVSPEVLARILDVIQPDSPNNPWKNKHARLRNYLLVRWLLSLGNRRGEILTIKISDINFQSNEVLVARRADDPEDPRRNQPRAKTNDRLLALDPDLVELTRRYIMTERRAVKGARRHEFLWVANGTGAPLSLSGFHKLFITLREKCPDLPDSLSAHVLRHTWNDVFSAQMDAAGVPEAEEQKMRTRLMGWSDTSSMASVYTRRHIKTKAREASLAMQSKLRLGASDDDNVF